MKVVSIAPYMPFRGIPHAGGELYRRHAELLSQTREVTVVCPRTPGNESALVRDPAAPYRRLLVSPHPPASWVHRSLHRFLSRVAPFVVVRPFLRGLLADEQTLTAMREADRIELQWFEAVALAPMLHQSLPGARFVGVFHDVVSQGYARTWSSQTAAFRSRVLSFVRLLLAIILEGRVMRVLDTAVVLSDKDRILLARRGGTARIVVVPPPLDDTDMPPAPPTDLPPGPEVLFVGALWRMENEDAATWLLDDIWPRVRAAVLGAHLTVAGDGAGEALRRVAERHGDVELTGYVESFSNYYRRASVVVAPLRRGAGVKLKTVVAMMWGVPVVATGVGAEGVEGPDVFAAVEDDPVRFADAVIRVLEAPGRIEDVRARAHAWAHSVYSTEAYVRRLARLYP